MNKQKLIGAIIGVLLFIVAIAGLTYAYTIWTSEDMNKIVSSKCFEVLYVKGNNFEGDLMPSDDYTGGVSLEIKMDIDSYCNMNAKGVLYLHIDEKTSENLFTEGLLNYQVLIDGELTSHKGNITSSGDIAIYLGLLNNNYVATTTYTIYVWIDKNLVTNEHAFSNFSGSVKAEAVQATDSPSVNLRDHITNLYTSSNPTLITHKDTEDNKIADYYYSYQDIDQTWGIMNDGLKAADEEGTGATVITDETTLTSGTEGNIRFFGPSDKVNNYIYFNCSNYYLQSSSTCEKWRIIGIVDGKVKIIRENIFDSLDGWGGDLGWDLDKNQGSASNSYDNNWKTSSLQEFLNGLYYNRGTITTYTSYNLIGFAGETESSTRLDMRTIGLKNDETRNMISTTTWYLGGYSTSDGLYPNDIYSYERTNKVGTTIYSGNPYTIDAKIGLMYPSDYSYGTNLKKCSQNLHDYDNSTDSYACIANNWLFNDDDGWANWLITPCSSDSSKVWSVMTDGEVYGRNYYAAHPLYVRPVLYLDPELVVESGREGTSADPHRLVIGNNTNNNTTENETIINHIRQLYNDAAKTVVTNNNINYNYAPTVRLMNDRLGSNSVAANRGNIRYYGKDDANLKNYIYFNCSDYNNQTDSTCEKWRIIGIVDGKVKLVRQGDIGSESWDLWNSDPSNNWKTSTLNAYLNGDYYNSLKAKNSKTIELISKSTYYLGGYYTSAIYSNQIYRYERTNQEGITIASGNPFIEETNIGIMYASDYGYGVDFNECSSNLFQYDNEECYSNDWLYSFYDWLITPNSDNSNCVWAIISKSTSKGYVDGYSKVANSYGTRPVLYLKPKLVMEAGHEGTSTDPYRISVS